MQIAARSECWEKIEVRFRADVRLVPMDLKETNFTGKLLKVFPGPVTTAIVGDDNLNIPGALLLPAR